MAASVYVVLYNTQLVPEAQAPRTWEDLLDPRWRGRLGTWSSAAGIAHLPKAWGIERATDYVRRFAAQEPLLYASTFPLAQAVASGELAVALGIFHTAQPPIQQGAPIRVVALEPTTISTIYTYVARNTRQPNAAKLLVAWLMTPEGAKAYEDATARGSIVLGPNTAQLVRGKTVVEFPPAELDQFTRLLEQYNELLKQGGRSGTR
jgi:iron(III) transport system substrate-binding protein